MLVERFQGTGNVLFYILGGGAGAFGDFPCVETLESAQAENFAAFRRQLLHDSFYFYTEFLVHEVIFRGDVGCDIERGAGFCDYLPLHVVETGIADHHEQQRARRHCCERESFLIKLDETLLDDILGNKNIPHESGRIIAQTWVILFE